MLNKKLVLCVALASTLGFATAATASVPGYYAGGQLGYGSIKYDNVNNASVNALNAALSPFASSNQQTNNTSNGGIAGRLFAGYDFGNNWATEAGYTLFSNEDDSQNVTNNNVPLIGTQSYGAKANISTHAVDLVAKGTLPVENGFSLYGKAGLAWVHAHSNNTTYGTTVLTASSVTDNRILPTGSVGIQYDVTDQLSADLSYTRIQKTGNARLIQSTNFGGAGLTYHFG